MPQVTSFIDGLRAAMEEVEPGSSHDFNQRMARAVRSERGLFCMTEQRADGETLQIGTP